MRFAPKPSRSPSTTGAERAEAEAKESMTATEALSLDLGAVCTELARTSGARDEALTGMQGRLEEAQRSVIEYEQAGVPQTTRNEICAGRATPSEARGSRLRRLS